ncbi:hypothetical protein [Paenibacillus chitinolyticus]|uniref:hypothetical protein n=1 Tax=Paenibacillus chitinolyticus TaxID=79263 RepID=UPI0036735651
MASLFDENRKRLGISNNSGNAPSNTNGKSLFDENRMRLGIIEDTRPSLTSKLTNNLMGAVSGLGSASGQVDLKAISQAQAEENKMNQRFGGTLNKRLTPGPVDQTEKLLNELKSNPVGYILNDNPVGEFLKRFSGSLRAHITPDAPFINNGQLDYSRPTPKQEALAQLQQYGNGGTSDKVADLLGQGASYVAPLPGMNPLLQDAYAATKLLGLTSVGEKLGQKIGQTSIGGIGSNIASKVGTGIANKANPILNNYGINLSTNLASKATQQFGRGAVAGAIYGANEPLLKSDGSLDEIPMSVLQNAAMGGVGDAALPFLGAAVKGVGGLLKKPAQQVDSLAVQELQPLRPVEQAKVPNALEEWEATLSNPNRERYSMPSISQLGKQVDQIETRPLQQELMPLQQEAQPVLKQRGTFDTLTQSPKATEAFKEGAERFRQYEPITNAETVAKANERVKNLDVAEGDLLNKTSKYNAEEVATGFRLIDEFQAQGMTERAVSIAEKLAENLTKAGQTIQAASIYNRLTPEGVLVYAQRMAKRVTEKLPPGKEVKVTTEMANQLTELAGTVQKMGGNKSAASNVVEILDKYRAGQTVTSEEKAAVQKFIQDAKTFVNSKTKQPKTARVPKEMGDARVKDKVVSFLEAQEQAAKERLRAKGIQISSGIDPTIAVNYAIIGASKLAKGTIKFADWSAEMVKDFGEAIRPHLGELYEKAQEQLLSSSKRISEETISKAEKIADQFIKNRDLSPKSVAEIEALAKKVSSLSGDVKTQASQDLQVVLNSLEKTGFLRKVDTIQTISHLLNAKTLLARNPIGNEIFYRVERLNRTLAAPVDWATSKLTGKDRTITIARNGWEDWFKPTKDFFEGLAIGARAGWKGVNPEGLTTQFDIRGQAFKSKLNPFSYLEKTLGAGLKGFDYAAYNRAVNQRLREMARLDAINRGLKGESLKRHTERYLMNIDDNVKSIADEYGKYITLQDDSLIAKGLQGAKRWMNAKQDFGFGSLVLKYPKTPGNIITRALEYSPAGFLKAAYEIAEPFLKKGSIKTREDVITSAMRASVGTGITGFGYYLADIGIITGASENDRDVRELERQAGQSQYQINGSALERWAKELVTGNFKSMKEAAKLREGDLLYNYDWAQPVSMAFSVGANLSESKKKNKKGLEVGESALSAAFESFTGGLNTITEQSVLKGVKDAFATNPGEDNTVLGFLKNVGSGALSSFVPTAVNQINQYRDNTKRETYDPSFIQKTINKAKVKVPGLSDSLPQAVDTLGKGKTNYQDNSLWNVFLNPSFTSRYNVTPEAKKVVDLLNATGDKRIAPRMVDKYISGTDKTTKQSKKIDLSPDQFVRYQKTVGEEAARLIGKIQDNKSNDAKVKAMIDALGKAGEKGRKELKKELNLK